MKNDKLIQFRVEENIKIRFEEFCRNVGFTPSTAISLMIKKSIAEKVLPFSLTVKGIPLKSDESVRMNVCVTQSDKEEFKKVCDSLGITMSMAIKLYMAQCYKAENIQIF